MTKQEQEKLTSPQTRRPWLSSVYEERKQRVIVIMEKSISALIESKKSVSLSSLVSTSLKIDPEGRGISESAILNNPVAKNIYEKYRTWKPKKKAFKIFYDEKDTNEQVLKKSGYHLKKLSKSQLIGKILKAEAECEKYKILWLRLNEEMFALQLNQRSKVKKQLTESVEKSPKNSR